MSLVLSNPPVREVVIAVYFDQPLPGFRSEHAGLFWDGIRPDFPTARQRGPYTPGRPENALPNAEDEFFPMPRFMFFSESGESLIQIQKDAFVFNWIKVDSESYGGFKDTVKPLFDKYYVLFDEFVRRELAIAGPFISLCEITYVNAVEMCEFWSGPEDTGNIIPSFAAIDVGEHSLEGMNCHYVFDLDEETMLEVEVSSGLTGESLDQKALRFEFKATGNLGQSLKSDADKWIDRTFRQIQECFLVMTAPHIREAYWGEDEVQE